MRSHCYSMWTHMWNNPISHRFISLLSYVMPFIKALTHHYADDAWTSIFFLAGGVFDCNLAHRRSVAELCMLFKLRVTQCILWAVHCLCRMCRCLLLVVLWLLIITHSCLLVVGLLSITEPLCPSRCLFGMILVTLCLMVWNWQVSRAEPMLSCWHDLLFLWCLLLFYLLLLPSMGWFCGVGVFGLIECSHSLPALHSGLQIIIIIIIIIIIVKCVPWHIFIVETWNFQTLFPIP